MCVKKKIKQKGNNKTHEYITYNLTNYCSHHFARNSRIGRKREMRKAKDFEYFSCKLDKNVAEILTKLSEETGLPKTTAVERAIKAYYQHYKKTGKV